MSPNKKVSVKDVEAVMRDHYEGTPLSVKLFFFPDVLEQKAHDGDKAAYVAGQLVGR